MEMMMVIVTMEIIGLMWLIAFEMREAAVYPKEVFWPIKKADLEKDLVRRKILFVVSMIILGATLYGAFLLWGEINHTHFGCLPLLFFIGALYTVDLNAKARKKAYGNKCFTNEYVEEMSFMANFSTWLGRICAVLMVITLVITVLMSRTPAYRYLEERTMDVVCEDIVASPSGKEVEGRYYLMEDLSKFYYGGGFKYLDTWDSSTCMLVQEMRNMDVYLIDCRAVKPHIVWRHGVKQKLLPDDYGRYVVADGMPQSYNSYALYINKDVFNSLVSEGKVNLIGCENAQVESPISSIHDLSGGEARVSGRC